MSVRIYEPIVDKRARVQTDVFIQLLSNVT